MNSCVSHSDSEAGVYFGAMTVVPVCYSDMPLTLRSPSVLAVDARGPFTPQLRKTLPAFTILSAVTRHGVRIIITGKKGRERMQSTVSLHAHMVNYLR